MEVLLSELVTIGKLQLLRRSITKQIHFMSKVECSQYESCLSTLNTTVLNNLQEIKTNANAAYAQAAEEGQGATLSEKEISEKLKLMLSNLTVALETVGIVNPLNKCYYLTRPLEKMSLFMALFSISALTQLQFDQTLLTFRKLEMKKEQFNVQLDGPHLIVGILTMFKQFHSSHYKTYLSHLAHYFKLQVQTYKGLQMPPDATNVLLWLDEIIKFDNEMREVVGQELGGFVFDCYTV